MGEYCVMESAFTEVTRDANFSTRYVKGVTFVNRTYTKWLPLMSNMVYKRVRDWTLGCSPGGGGGGVHPNITYTGMCRPTGS